MAKRLAVPSKDSQLYIVGALEAFKASRIQRLNIKKDVPSTTIDELGNRLHVGDIADIPNVTLTFSAFDVGIKIFSVLTGVDYLAYPAAGVDIAELGEMDAIVLTKDDDAEDYVKSMHAKRLQIRDFAFSYSVDGESTEDYTAIGSEERYLKYNVKVEKFITGTTTFTIAGTPRVLKNGSYILSAILDGEYLEEVSGTPDAIGEFSYDNGTKTITTYDTRGSQLLVLFHEDTAGDNWSDVGDTGMPAAIRGKEVTVTISANSIPRVQNVTINGTMNVQPVKEMGNKNIVGYQRQIPTVDGTITVLDTDTELISLLTTGVLGSGEEWQPGEGCTTVTVSLEVKLYNPCDDTDVEKTVYVPEITIVGDGYAQNVGNNATLTFNWKSTDARCLIYSGAR
jgi:hypothetical protein